MICVTSAVVLARRPYREYDRIAHVYTRTHGRVLARFAGVNRPRGKLKALSEPMVHAEFRFYHRAASPWWTVTGGHLVNTYPGLRASLGSMIEGLEMCELLLRMTPEGSPNPDKFDLIVECLDALEVAPSPCVTTAFALRLVQMAGLGPEMSKFTEEDYALWRCLCETPPALLNTVSCRPQALRRLRAITEATVERHIEAPIQSRLFKDSMGRAAQRVLEPKMESSTLLSPV